MFEEILNRQISSQDRIRSISSLAQLRPYIVEKARSLVFFVGAGASSAGNTGMPSTQALLHQLLLDALVRSGKFDRDDVSLKSAITRAVASLGFEITLNDLWQICREAIALFFESFATLEKTCLPNRAHAFLAYWLSSGGTVLTTNYDRLIEAEWIGRGQAIRMRFKEAGENSFETWEKDLARGSCLFKLHGSLDEPESCLGALEHVGTCLAGNRAALLKAIMRDRPICFVGWRGADPDIPPALAELSSSRSPDLPSFWIHHHGFPPGSKDLHSAIEEVSTDLRKFAGDRPVLTDADQFFGELLNWVGVHMDPNPNRQPVVPVWGKVLRQCSRSGLARFAGIVLRRADEFRMASSALLVAEGLAGSTEERAAAIQEIAQVKWSRDRGLDKVEARELVQIARDGLESSSDLLLALNADFGLLSMTILSIKSRPWLILSVPKLFRRYKLHIDQLKDEPVFKKSLALHESLMYLYLGRLRFELFGGLGVVVKPVADWILRPFNVARSVIGDARDIHIHSRIDVLSYRAVAMAWFGRCDDIREDIQETDRLTEILKDEARAMHWEHQRREVEQRCPEKRSA